MNGKELFWFVIAASIYSAILVMLVRPSSKGPQLIGTILDALANLLQGVTGMGTQGTTQ